VEEAEAMLILFYKKEQEPSMTALDGLSFQLLKNVTDWDDQYDEIIASVNSKHQQRVHLLQLTHTPRNLGQINIQILWYLPASEKLPATPVAKHFVNKGNIEALQEEARAYLNEYVSPSNLLSYSVFEDDHPCDNQLYHAVAYLKAEPAKPLTKTDDIQGDIYKVKNFTSHSWENAVEQALGFIEGLGLNEYGQQISTQNQSEGDRKTISILYWAKTHQDLLSD
jgi:hypothetical protein